MRRALVVAAAALGLAIFAACSGTASPSGLGEPIRVRNGVFKEGRLPGAPPVEEGGELPLVTAIDTPSTVLRPGQGEKSLSGRVSPGSVAIALGFANAGTGYWVVPVEGPDPLNRGELGWNAALEIARTAPEGSGELRMVAVDGAGHAGTQRALPVCVPSAVPDNLNACDRTLAPPAEVVSLSWDAPVDLDIVVVTPDYRVVDAKHPRLLGPEADAGAGPQAAIDRDSNGSCVIDGIQRESLVFPEAPAPGSYLVYANLFDACGAAPVHFEVSLWERQPAPGGVGFVQVRTDLAHGTLTAEAVNGGSKLGTFVTEIDF